MSPVMLFRETREQGFRNAWSRFIDRRHLPVVGYLILASFTGYAFAQERNHSNENREALATQTHNTLVAGCERQNQLRTTLQGLIRSGIPQTRQYVKDGTLTPAQGDRAIAQAQTAIHTLRPTDCKKVYPIK